MPDIAFLWPSRTYNILNKIPFTLVKYRLDLQMRVALHQIKWLPGQSSRCSVKFMSKCNEDCDLCIYVTEVTCADTLTSTLIGAYMWQRSLVQILWHLPWLVHICDRGHLCRYFDIYPDWCIYVTEVTCADTLTPMYSVSFGVWWIITQWHLTLVDIGGGGRGV